MCEKNSQYVEEQKKKMRKNLARILFIRPGLFENMYLMSVCWLSGTVVAQPIIEQRLLTIPS